MNFIHESNRVYSLDEKNNIIAEITFPPYGDCVVINHTFVDDSLRGQGVAGMLVKEAYNEIKKANKKAKVTCSYAIKFFEKNKEFADILSEI